MPLNKKGKKIMKSMTDTYCEKGDKKPCKKAKEVFYASKNKGTIEDVEVQTEALRGFIRGLKRGDNEYLIENVILKALDACFEVTTLTNNSTDEPLPSEKTEEQINTEEENVEEKTQDLKELQAGQITVEEKVGEMKKKAEEAAKQADANA